MSRTTKRRPHIDNAAIAALELRVARLIMALREAERLAEELRDFFDEKEYRKMKGLNKMERDEFLTHAEYLDEGILPDLGPLLWQFDCFAGFMEDSIWAGQMDLAREENLQG
jgi:hypothetical protein